MHRHPLGTQGWAARVGLAHPHARQRVGRVADEVLASAYVTAAPAPRRYLMEAVKRAGASSKVVATRGLEAVLSATVESHRPVAAEDGPEAPG